MKRNIHRKLRLKLQLAGFKNGKLIHKTTKRKKTAILKEISVLKTQNPNLWTIRAVYGKAMNVWGEHTVFSNSGEYKSLPELLIALNAFTEPDIAEGFDR